VHIPGPSGRGAFATRQSHPPRALTRTVVMDDVTRNIRALNQDRAPGGKGWQP